MYVRTYIHVCHNDCVDVSYSNLLLGDQASMNVYVIHCRVSFNYSLGGGSCMQNFSCKVAFGNNYYRAIKVTYSSWLFWGGGEAPSPSPLDVYAWLYTCAC